MRPSLKFRIRNWIREYRNKHQNLNMHCIFVEFRCQQIGNFFWGIRSCIISSWRYMFHKTSTLQDQVRKHKENNLQASRLVNNHLMKDSVARMKKQYRGKFMTEFYRGKHNQHPSQNLPEIGGEEPVDV